MQVHFLVDIDPEYRTGLFNAVAERVACVRPAVVFNLSYVDSRFIRFVKSIVGAQPKEKKRSFRIGESTYESVHLPADVWYYGSRVFGLLLAPVVAREARIVRQQIGQDADLVSAHWGRTAGLIAHRISQLTGAPFVVTYHGSDIHLYPRSKPGLKRMTIRSLEQAGGNIFVSDALLREARDLGYSGNNAVVIRNGVDLNRYTRAARKGAEAGGAPVIGYVGNMWHVKGADRLPEICNRILAAVPGATFVFAGDGDCMAGIQANVDPQKVTLLGRIEPHAVPDVMKGFDLLMMPSRNEGLPLVLLEALATGVPVVASRVGGIPEVLTEEYLVEPGADFEQRFAARVVTTLETGAEASLDPSYDWQHVRSEERRLYESLVTGKGEGAGT